MKLKWQMIFILAVCLALCIVQRGAATEQTQSADFNKDMDLLPGVDLDINKYYPSGGPLRLHVVLEVGDTLNWNMSGQAVLEYPPGLNLHYEGSNGSAAMELGFEFGAFIYIDVWVWDGEFSVPGIPHIDFMFDDNGTFNPFLLPGNSPRSFTLYDQLDSYLELFCLDLTDAVLPIPGIGAGFCLLLTGGLDVETEGSSMIVDGKTITREEESVTLPVPANNTLSVNTTWKGHVSPEADVIFNPALFIQIPLIGRLTLPTVDIGIPIPLGTYPLTIGPDNATFSLPDIEVSTLELGFGGDLTSPLTETVDIVNSGQHNLEIYQLTISGSQAFGVVSPSPSHSNPLVIGQGQTQTCTVSLTPTGDASYSGTLTIGSDDPDEWDSCKVHLSGGELSTKWAFETGDGIYSSPAIGSDGTIYVGSRDNFLYAINPDGTQKWTFETGLYITSSPAIGSDGTIYVGSGDNKLYAVNPDGTQKWAFETGLWVTSSPAIGSDGTIYVGSGDNFLYAVNPDGTQKWSFETGGRITSSPAIGSDGVIYVGCYSDHKLYAINSNGTQKWTFETGNWIDSSPAIGEDGTIYVGSWDHFLYAINSDGTQKWAFETGDWIYSSPAIGADGTIYVGSGDNKLYAVNSNGTQRWAFETGSRASSSPAVGADGIIYIGSTDEKLYAINPDGTEKTSMPFYGSVTSSPAIERNGIVYVGSANGNLYALYSNSPGLADTPWPMFRYDVMHTGSALPQAAFVANPTWGLTFPHEVNFEDRSTGYNITSWLWDFGDGNTSTEQHPVHTYNLPGVYTVSLTASSLLGENTVTKTNYIRVEHVKAIYETLAYDYWRNLYDGVYISPPAVDPDGTIYVKTADRISGYPHENLYSINSDGKETWYTFCGDETASYESPVIGADGTVYVTSCDSLIAIKPKTQSSPTVAWSFDIGESSVSYAPVIGPDGTIYVRSYGNGLYAIEDKGTYGQEKWQFLTETYYSVPAIGADGTIYVGGHSTVYAINPDGTEKWHFGLGGQVGGSLGIGADGTIYVGSWGDDQGVYAINPDGTEKWHFAIGDDIYYSAPIIGADGTIYVFTRFYQGWPDYNYHSSLYAIEDKGGYGQEKWQFSTGEGKSYTPTPAIGADGTIYVGSLDYNFYAINPDGTEKWRFETENQVFSAPAIGADGNIYVGSYESGYTGSKNRNGIYIFWDDMGGPATSSWPMLGHDQMRTGSAAVQARFSVSSEIGVAPATIQFNDITIGDVTGWDWDFGDGGASSDENPVHTYTSAGSYSVSLTVYYGTGGSHTWTWTDCVTVQDNYYKWNFETGGGIRSSPAMGEDGTIYVGSDDGRLYAVNPYGTQKWYFEAGSYIGSSPAIGDDGTIYVGCFDNNVYAISSNGTQRWAFETGGFVYASPAIGSDGTVYVGSYDYNLYAINPNGTQKWVYPTESYIESSAAIGADGTIYVGSHDYKLHAVNPDGTQRWVFEAGGRISSSPAIGKDGTIYVGSWDDHKIYAINLDGTLRWAFETGGGVYSSPAIGEDGTIYVGSADGKLYAINRNGARQWAFDTGDGVYSSPAIGDDGTIYVGSNNGKIFAISSDGIQQWVYETFGYDFYSSPIIASDGTVYVGSRDGNLYAFYSKSTGPADSPWPMFGQNAQHGSAVFVSPVVIADFYVAPTEGMAPLTVDFFDESLGTITSWLWNFGDGDTSNDQHPTHTYTDAGDYSVTLAVTGPGGSDTESATIVVKPSRLVWSYDTGGNVTSSPAVAEDGTIYVGSYNGSLFAFNTDGTRKWEDPLGGPTRSSPAIGTDGRIYIGSMDGKLYALSDNGSYAIKLWSFQAGDTIYASPAIGADDSIYVGSLDGSLYAINEDGTKRWSFSTGGEIHSSAAIGPDNTVYVGSDDGNVYAIKPDGTEKWHFLTGGPVRSSPALGSDGTVYVGSADQQCYAINPDGTEKWHFTTSGEIHASPVIGDDGTVYVGSLDQRLYAINADGSEKWHFTTSAGIHSSAAIGDDGTLHVGSSDGYVYALDENGDKIWSFDVQDEVISSPVIDTNGVLYVGAEDGMLYAFDSSSSSPADSTWPMFRFNQGRTGSKAQCIATRSLPLSILPGEEFTVTIDLNVKEGMEPDTLKIVEWLDPGMTFISSTPPHTSYSSGEVIWVLDTVSDINISYTATCSGCDLGTKAFQGYLEIYSEAQNLSTMVSILGDQTTTVEYPLSFMEDINQTIPIEGAAGTWVDYDNDGDLDLIVAGEADVPEETWSLSTGVADPQAHIGPDGSVYVLSAASGILRSLDHDGNEEWNFAADEVAIGPDGTVYVIGDDGSGIAVYALNPDDKTVKWYNGLAGDLHGLTVGPDGTVYVGSSIVLYALYPDNGDVKWSFDELPTALFTPGVSLDPEKPVYAFCESPSMIYALNPDGTWKWDRSIGYFSWSLGPDGTVYLNVFQLLLSIDSETGDTKWSFPLSLNLGNPIVVAGDGTVYTFYSPGYYLMAFNPDGSLKWSSAIGGDRIILGKDGIVYVTDSSVLNALNPDGSQKWTMNMGSPISTIAIGTQGSIYLGFADGTLTALSPSVSEIYSNDNGVLVLDDSQSLPGLLMGQNFGGMAWGDYDGNGWLDLAVLGWIAGDPVVEFYKNTNGSLSEDTSQNLPGMSGNMAWGDYDNDGDLDLAVTGHDTDMPVTRIYQNNGGLLIEDTSLNLTGLSQGSVAWGDYDQDGDLDLAVSGHSEAGNDAVIIYNNSNGMLTQDTGQSIVGLSQSTLAWVDYDSDGDPDLALMGIRDVAHCQDDFEWDGDVDGSDLANFAKDGDVDGSDLAIFAADFGRTDCATLANLARFALYRNEGGKLTAAQIIDNLGLGTFAFGDYDNDGDFDFVLTGWFGDGIEFYKNTVGLLSIDDNQDYSGIYGCSVSFADYDKDGDLDLMVGSYGEDVKIVKNGISYVNPNDPPSEPQNLTSGVSGAEVTLSWNAGSDNESPEETLSYTLCVGTTSNGSDVMSGAIPPGPGNMGHRLSYVIKGLGAGTYYWSVQTVDTGFEKSSWASEQSFSIE